MGLGLDVPAKGDVSYVGSTSRRCRVRGTKGRKPANFALDAEPREGPPPQRRQQRRVVACIARGDHIALMGKRTEPSSTTGIGDADPREVSEHTPRFELAVAGDESRCGTARRTSFAGRLAAEVKAAVVFAFFGFNESSRAKRAAAVRTDLAKVV